MDIRAGQEELWQKSLDVNTDPYGARIMSYAKDWAELMEKELSEGGEPAEVIPRVAQATSLVADYDGITGYMHGAAVATLAGVWEHGEVLRRWHNKAVQLGTEGDAANESGAVLNPDLITFQI